LLIRQKIKKTEINKDYDCIVHKLGF
jgi:hypothetical protein